jgi:hypothetical protein
MATEEELKEIIRKKRGGRWIEYHGPYKIGAADVSLPALFSLRLCGGSLLTALPCATNLFRRKLMESRVPKCRRGS